MAEEPGGRDGLRENDADGNEDGAGTGSKGDSYFNAGTFRILIAAAERDAASVPDCDAEREPRRGRRNSEAAE